VTHRSLARDSQDLRAENVHTEERTMASCEVCGNDYDKAFTVTTHDGADHTFDSFECAMHALAPTCSHCGCRVVGHGMESDNEFYCCAHCAEKAGVTGMADRA
jgi:hypothetical protein